MRFEAFLCTILLLGMTVSVKMIKRSGISDFERRLNVTPEEDPTAMMDSADNGKLISRYRKPSDEVAESAESLE